MVSEARYGHCHNIWSSCGTEPFAVTMATLKVKLATGMLTLQEHKAKFARKGEVSSLCPMCKKETEKYFSEISSSFENQLSEF
jgi:hypothetical protein